MIAILGAEELRPYRLINADLGTATENNGERVMKLTGNVHFFYGETEFFSNTAELFENQKKTVLAGNVRVLEDSLSLNADEVEYFQVEEKLDLRGNVLAREDHEDLTFRTFAADSITYFRNTGILDAWSDVHVFDERKSAEGYCGILHYEMANGYGYLLQRPKISVDDSLKISAEKIEYHEEFSKVTANFDVVTESNDFTITSDFLLYFEQEQKAIFLGEPKFNSDFADAAAVEMQVFFVEQELSRAELTGECEVHFATRKDAPRDNWIKSQQMIFNFTDGELSLCEAETDVTSFYQQDKKRSKKFMINRAAAQKMKVYFTNQEIDEIFLEKDIDGVYKFSR